MNVFLSYLWPSVNYTVNEKLNVAFKMLAQTLWRMSLLCAIYSPSVSITPSGDILVMVPRNHKSNFNSTTHACWNNHTCVLEQSRMRVGTVHYCLSYKAIIVQLEPYFIVGLPISVSKTTQEGPCQELLITKI